MASPRVAFFYSIQLNFFMIQRLYIFNVGIPCQKYFFFFFNLNSTIQYFTRFTGFICWISPPSSFLSFPLKVKIQGCHIWALSLLTSAYHPRVAIQLLWHRSWFEMKRTFKTSLARLSRILFVRQILMFGKAHTNRSLLSWSQS